MIACLLKIIMIKNRNYVMQVKGDFFYKTILVKTSFAVAFEFLNIGIEPDRFAEIKVVADPVSYTHLLALLPSRSGSKRTMWRKRLYFPGISAI